jgi:hypothetical protein
MSDSDLAPALNKLLQQLEHSSRLEFLYKAVEDTQNTIRFIDTKAAFCVTLLSGMAAGVLQGHREPHTGLQKVLLAVFLLAVAFSLMVCLRVIFPVIKPHSDSTPHTDRTVPKFFISHHSSHHWIRHTLSSSVDDVLCEDRSSYTATLFGAADEDLLHAMCDEVLMISLIRQIKSDRLHAAMYSLAGTIVVFAAVMLS